MFVKPWHTFTCLKVLIVIILKGEESIVPDAGENKVKI